MFKTLATVLKDNWDWRAQIGRLAVFELVKRSRGAMLSWAWFFVRPAIYIFCFWFALEIGLRATKTMGLDSGVPYIIWLSSGLIPWFFMQEFLGAGTEVLKHFSYLVTKIKFPISAIPTIHAVSVFIIHLMLMACLFVMYAIAGLPWDIYLLQVPLIMILMFVFWDAFSMLISHLSAFSKDVSNLVKALATPMFWLSGIIFDLSMINIDWIQGLMDFNPVTTYVTVMRDAMCYKTWFWDDPGVLMGFVIVFIVTVVLSLFVYHRFNKEVSDVL
ncbi:MAG: ABC transporter [Coriobacteriaceae bacterium]|nr:ABC transporter [Coriobacteriaceae bacterium]